MKNRQQQHQQRVQQRQQRENKERSHFTAPVTGKQARHIAGAEANQTYGETDNQIKGQIRASGAQQARVGNWYDTFANEIAASRGEVAGAYNQANTAISGNMATAAADNTARDAALSAQDAKFAQLTGAPQNTSGPHTDAAAQGQRELYGAALAAPVAAAGAAAYAYLTDQKNNAKGEGIYQKVQERKRRQSLQQDRKSLLKEKGQYRTTKLDEIRSREQGRADEKWKINKAFPLEQQAANENAANTATDNRTAARNAATSERNAATSEYNAHHEAGEKGGRTPSEKNAAKEGRRNAAATAKTLFEKRKWKSWAELTQRVAKESEVSPAEAREAVARLRKRVEREQAAAALEAGKDPNGASLGR